jgi:hypothetical protein
MDFPLKNVRAFRVSFCNVAFDRKFPGNEQIDGNRNAEGFHRQPQKCSVLFIWKDCYEFDSMA